MRAHTVDLVTEEEEGRNPAGHMSGRYKREMTVSVSFQSRLICFSVRILPSLTNSPVLHLFCLLIKSLDRICGRGWIKTLPGDAALREPTAICRDTVAPFVVCNCSYEPFENNKTTMNALYPASFLQLKHHFYLTFHPLRISSLERCLTHQRLGVLFGGRQKLSDIGRGFLLDGMSPLGGLAPLWLGCRGNGQEHGRSWCS